MIHANTNAAAGYAKELKAVYAIFDVRTLKDFLYSNAGETVGVNRGQETTTQCSPI